MVLALFTLLLATYADTLVGQNGTLFYDFPDLGTHFSTGAFTVPANVVTLTYRPDLANAIGVISDDKVHITFGNISYSFTAADCLSFDENCQRIDVRCEEGLAADVADHAAARAALVPVRLDEADVFVDVAVGALDHISCQPRQQLRPRSRHSLMGLTL